MKKDGKALLEKERKKLSVQAMYFNRYLLVRYVSAFFFFTNLYWLILSLLSDSSFYFIPLILMVVFIFNFAEQVKMYSTPSNNPKYTKFSFIIILFTNVLLLLLACIPSSFAQLYPFLVNQVQSRIAVFIILLTGIAISVLILYRLNQIKHNEDKQYKRIKQYEKAINI